MYHVLTVVQFTLNEQSPAKIKSDDRIRIKAIAPQRKYGVCIHSFKKFVVFVTFAKKN